MTILYFAKSTKSMEKILLDNYTTLNQTDKNWSNHNLQNALTVVSESHDDVLIQYDFAKEWATLHDILSRDEFQYVALFDVRKILIDIFT